MEYDLEELARNIGFFVSRCEGEYGRVLSIDPPDAVLRRYYAPVIRKKGDAFYAYGDVGIALAALKRTPLSRSYLAHNTQNIPSLRISTANVSSPKLAGEYFSAVKIYLATLPGSVADLLAAAQDTSHWIGASVNTFKFPSVTQFRNDLVEYFREQSRGNKR